MAALMSITFVLLGGAGAIFEASGRDSDLTGRTENWDIVVTLVQRRPLLGWGYLVYWRDEGFVGGSSGFERFGLRSAHSGYLEVALGAGVVASLVVVLTLLHLMIVGYRRLFSRGGHVADAGLVAVAVLTMFLNISESLFPSSVWTLPTLLLLVLGARSAGRSRQRARMRSSLRRNRFVGDARWSLGIFAARSVSSLVFVVVVSRSLRAQPMACSLVTSILTSLASVVFTGGISHVMTMAAARSDGTAGRVLVAGLRFSGGAFLPVLACYVMVASVVLSVPVWPALLLFGADVVVAGAARSGRVCTHRPGAVQ